jgi:putative oxygen-independent coproporphyrinogen III oxidase
MAGIEQIMAIPETSSDMPPMEWFWRTGSLQLEALPPLSLYVHIPWCLKKCPYCDFNSHGARDTTQLPVDLYIQALLRDLEKSLPLIWGRTIHTIFFGGGTPSLFPPKAIEQLIDQIRARLPLAFDCEITLEANPGTFEAQRFAGYRAAGITRLSVGVQSFSSQNLQALGRVHTGEQAISAIEEVARHFSTWNLDLMYALPNQTVVQLKEDLDTAIRMAPSHLSIYHLTIEPNTYFAKYPPAAVSDELASDMLDEIERHVEDAGLQRYEVSAFARPNHRCMHNTNYWKFGDYLGIGAGAHSKLSFAHRIVRLVRFREPNRYMQQALAHAPIAQIEEVQRNALPFEFMLNTLRLKEGFHPNLFYERTGQTMATIERQLDEAEKKGLIIRTLDLIAPTQRGFDFLNDLQMIFLPKN